jgi:SH3 domain-containing YSC84-like protein 1
MASPIVRTVRETDGKEHMDSGIRKRWCTGVFVVVAAVLASCILGATSASAASEKKADAERLVAKSRLTFEAFVADKDMGPPLKALLARAKGVLIYPQVLKGAFIVGAAGGSGVMLAHEEKGARWTGPAFYTMGEASFGLQIGGEAMEVVLVALTEKGVSALLSTSVKLGGNVGIAAGPVGAGAAAATQNLSADIVSYARAKGLYAGISLDGAVVDVRESLNDAYYGKKVTTTDILIKGTVKNAQANKLKAEVSKAAGRK